MVSKEKALKQLNELKKDVKPMRLAAQKWKNDFQTLISIILSARTKDETTIPVCEKLFKKYPTPKKFSKLNRREIKKLIYSVNFNNNKSRMIFNCTKEILKRFGGKVPKKFEELITLPGVGRKTANVFLAEYGEENIGVDTHVNYISNYLGWTNSKNPKKIEEHLKELFPRKKWKEINETLVKFGKSHTSKREKNRLLDKIKKKF